MTVALLRHNTSLQELDLTATDIEKEGATALATAFEFNSTLVKLHVGYNPMLDDRSKALLAEAQGKAAPQEGRCCVANAAHAAVSRCSRAGTEQSFSARAHFSCAQHNKTTGPGPLVVSGGRPLPPSQ